MSCGQLDYCNYYYPNDIVKGNIIFGTSLNVG